MVLKRSAMEQIALTGRSGDHFWGLRAFTPAERARWLRFLLDLHLNRPGVHLYFLRDETAVADLEFTFYAGVGLLIVPDGTHYDLERDYDEALVKHPDVLTHFEHYFFTHVIRDNCLSEEETAAALRDLIALAEAQEPRA